MKVPIWDDMRPKTRMTLIIVVGCVLIASMITGNFNTIMEVFNGSGTIQ